MNKRLITACVICFSLSGCSGDGKTTTATKNDTKETGVAEKTMQDDTAVVIVNGKAISEELFNAYIKQREANLPAGTTKQRILDELINFELVIQDALTKGLDKKSNIAIELQLQRRNILASAAFIDYVNQNPLTEEKMRSDYEARMSDLTLVEYKLRHILSNNEANAKKVLAELNKGEDIIALAKKYSTGSSANDGGDLGWQSETEVLPAIREKAKALKKGQHATDVIKTRFGWHVIYMEDRRETPPPAFEKVKDRVKNVLQRRQIEEYIVSLRANAQVDIKKPIKATPTTIPKALQPTGKPDIMMRNY